MLPIIIPRLVSSKDPDEGSSETETSSGSVLYDGVAAEVDVDATFDDTDTIGDLWGSEDGDGNDGTR